MALEKFTFQFVRTSMTVRISLFLCYPRLITSVLYTFWFETRSLKFCLIWIGKLAAWPMDWNLFTVRCTLNRWVEEQTFVGSYMPLLFEYPTDAGNSKAWRVTNAKCKHFSCEIHEDSMKPLTSRKLLCSNPDDNWGNWCKFPERTPWLLFACDLAS